ncbi:MAG: hypothetical protein R3228_07920 [Halioglobus sp.]|nr:hypothetical protein [Halioglobus sp.]
MNRNPFKSGLLPWQLKVAYVAWIAVWIPVYCIHYDPRNLLWMCDVANILLMFALCLELPVLLSAQAVGVLLVQVAWMLDYFGALLFGVHVFGGTQYMFDTQYPLWLRAMSLFHVVVPPLLLWSLWRLGYDGRGLRLQTLIIWVLLPVTFAVGDPEQNVNWLWSPFGIEQTLVPPPYFVGVMMLAYPLILFVPTHFLLRRLFAPPRATERVAADAAGDA